jgi:IS4 transposase
VQVVVVKRYSKGRYARLKSKWFAYAVSGLPVGILPAQVFEIYRQHFGIESSYRQMNQVCARTSTRNPVIRLLLVGLAFVLFNLFFTPKFVVRAQATVTIAKTFLVILAPLGSLAQSRNRKIMGHH